MSDFLPRLVASYVAMPDPTSDSPTAGVTWPNPLDPEGVQWRLRYGEPSKTDFLVAASFVSAYAYLFEMSQKDRNARIETIKAALRTSSDSIPGGES